MIRSAVLGLIAMLMATPPAVAHPHVWVDAQVSLRIEGGRIAEVDLDWRFDEFFSAVLFEEFDWDGDGAFVGEEIEAMRAAAFNGLSGAGFFTDLRIDGAQIEWASILRFSAEADDAGRVSYRFSLAPAEEVDSSGILTVSLYDPEFYVYVGLIEDDPIRTVGTDGMDCGYTLEEAEDNPIYFGTVFPIRAVLACHDVSG